MNTSNSSLCFGKIVNPDLAFPALYGKELYGEFKAIVRLAKPETCPSGMKITKSYTEDLFKVRIPCNQFEEMTNDRNVLSIELREYIS